MMQVDEFVILDDVQYINHGWVNRNLTPVNGELCYFTLPIRRPKSSDLIKDVVCNVTPHVRRKLYRRFKETYSKRHFYEIWPKVAHCFAQGSGPILTRAVQSLRATFSCLRCLHAQKPKFVYSSVLRLPDGVTGLDRLIAIADIRGATEILFSSGGRSLYEESQFPGCKVRFMPETDRDPPFVSVLHNLFYDGPEALGRKVSMNG